jgi:hypothetical protein
MADVVARQKDRSRLVLMLDNFLEMQQAWRDVLEVWKVMTESQADEGRITRRAGQNRCRKMRQLGA